MPFQQLGATRRKTFGTADFGIYDLRGGLNVKDLPQEVADNQLTVSVNGYLQVAGGWRMRNGMTARGTGLTGTASPILSGKRFWQTVKNGAPVTPATVKLVVQVGNDLYDYDNDVLIGPIGTAGVPQPATYARCGDPNDPNAGFTAGANDVLVICTGSGGPYIYDGTNLYTPAGWAAAAGASWCALVNGILWFGGIPTNPRYVYGTGDGIDASFESLPGYNLFNMSYPVTGLTAVTNEGVDMLLIGMTNGASILYGTGPTNFILQDIPSFNDGVMAGHTMLAYEGTAMWLGRQAWYAYNGILPQPLSNNVEPWILNDPSIPGYPMTQNRNLSYAFIYNNRLHIGYCSDNATPNAILCYNLLLNAWDGVLVTTPNLNCAIALDAPSDPSPVQMVMGSSAGPQLYDWDIFPPINSAATDAGSNIFAQMQTKFFKIGVPGTLKSLLRVYPELYVSGPFTGELTVALDYGASASNYTVPVAPQQSGAEWDVMLWDVGLWAAGGSFAPFVAPDSRVDVDEPQFESCALGISTSSGSSPWIFGGFTGTYRQLGRA